MPIPDKFKCGTISLYRLRTSSKPWQGRWSELKVNTCLSCVDATGEKLDKLLIRKILHNSKQQVDLGIATNHHQIQNMVLDCLHRKEIMSDQL